MIFERYKKSTVDWYAFYHQRLEQKGEDVRIGADYRSKDPELNRKFLFSHSSCDADAALRRGMVEIGYSPDVFPSAKPLKNPDIKKVWPTLFRFLRKQIPRRRRLFWKYGKATLPFYTHGPCELTFSKDETSAIFKASRKQKAVYSSMLLWAFNKAVAECFLKDATTLGWHIPVNIRGWKQNTEEYSNQLTNFVQFIDVHQNPSQIKSKSFEMLKQGWHFANIFFMNIGDWPGFGWVLRLKIYLDYAKLTKSEQIAGTFSSIGKWPLKGSVLLNEDDLVVPYGNVTLKNPLCLVNILWDERLCLTIQAHSSVCDRKEQLLELRSCMKKNLLDLIKEKF